MKPLKSFNEFLMLGIVKKQAPDKSRSKFLVEETEISFEGLNERLEKMRINNKNANSIVKDCYDILMSLIRARMCLDGYKSVGAGAHEAEVAYMKLLKIDQRDVDFINQIRYLRNGTIYYGTILDEIYAQNVVGFTKKMYLKLKGLLKE